MNDSKAKHWRLQRMQKACSTKERVVGAREFGGAILGKMQLKKSKFTENVEKMSR